MTDHRQWTNRRVVRLALALVLAGAAAGCSGNDEDSSTSFDESAPAVAAAAVETTAAAATDTIAVAAEAAAETIAPPADAGVGGGGIDTPVGPDSAAPEVFRAVISTAALTITVDDVAASAASVRSAAAAAGGFVASSEESAADEGGAVVTIKVPPGDFGRLLDELGSLGTVERREIESEDVTDQVVDLDARIDVMRAGVARLTELIGETSNIGEIASLEAELTRRTADLESIEGQLRVLSSQVSLSTITVTLRPVPVIAPEPPIELVGEVRTTPSFLDGLQAGWESLVDAARTVSVGIGAIVPWLIPASVLGIAMLVARRIRRRGRMVVPQLPMP